MRNVSSTSSNSVFIHANCLRIVLGTVLYCMSNSRSGKHEIACSVSAGIVESYLLSLMSNYYSVSQHFY